MNRVTIETIQNLRETNSKVIKLIDIGSRMTDKQMNLLTVIMELCSGDPERQQYAKNYTGRMADLPAALARI